MAAKKTRKAVRKGIKSDTIHCTTVGYDQTRENLLNTRIFTRREVSSAKTRVLGLKSLLVLTFLVGCSEEHSHLFVVSTLCYSMPVNTMARILPYSFTTSTFTFASLNSLLTTNNLIGCVMKPCFSPISTR